MSEADIAVNRHGSIVEISNASADRSRSLTLVNKYRLRWKRRRFLFRLLRKRRELTEIKNRTANVGRDSILAFSTVRNELPRLPYFLKYYRELGIDHFFFVDNLSDDGTTEYLKSQPDVSIWSTAESYRNSRFGVDWVGWLKLKFGHGRWCLTVDADEIFVFPNSENKTLKNLAKYLDDQNLQSFGALMIDMYPKGKLGEQSTEFDQDPLEVISWFDSDGYWTQLHPVYKNQWIQGGPRARLFFEDEKSKAPTLNKIPFVKWDRRYAYINSTHQILPIKLHERFDPRKTDQMTGAILHTKFLPQIVTKSEEELERKQHFSNSEKYTSYHEALAKHPRLWTEQSKKYRNTQQLVDLGLISTGNDRL